MKQHIFSRVSIILPVLNNGEVLREHLEHLKPALPLFGQIIAVDSYSEDNSFELLKTKLSSFNATIYQRPRGLYESWNSAIKKAVLPYTYISTIGDLPDLEKLEHFFQGVMHSNADIGISPPDIINSDNAPGNNTWPIHGIIKEYDLRYPLLIKGNDMKLLNYYSLCRYGPCSLSGSFASNLVRTKLFHDNSFPAEFHGAGDTVWWCEVCSSVSTYIYPDTVSRFLRHEKSYPSLSNNQIEILYKRLFASSGYSFNQSEYFAISIEQCKAYMRESKRKYSLFRYLIPETHRVRFLKKTYREELLLLMSDTKTVLRLVFKKLIS